MADISQHGPTKVSAEVLKAVGYGLAAFAKPIFPLATTIGWVVAARFIDRIGKGIRDAPRAALVAGLAPTDMRGASFGLRQAVDTVGNVAGPLAAIANLLAPMRDICVLVYVIRDLQRQQVDGGIHRLAP
jgi:MFS family permease